MRIVVSVANFLQPKSSSVKRPRVWSSACAIAVLWIATAPATFAQTFNTVVNFGGSNGSNPLAIAQGSDGNLWGGTEGSGGASCGTLFNTTLTGDLTTLFRFACADGDQAWDVILGFDGNYYGVTFFGGPDNDGTIFKLTPLGTVTLLHSFNGSDGSAPTSIIQAEDGNFYGSTYHGGSLGNGTIYKMTPTGALSTLYTFDSTHGAGPYSKLTLGVDGNLYGTTSNGGDFGGGTVYRVSLSGTITVLHSFGQTSTSGYGPVNRPVQGPDGNFYGSTPYGGTAAKGTLYRVTPAGTFTNIHNFTGLDGYFPVGMILGSDGNFYGTTEQGGSSGVGLIYELAIPGGLTTLHTFTVTDGEFPFGLIQHTDGTFYGLTNATNAGTLFSLSTGLTPFVSPLPFLGASGTTIAILGTGLTGATSVSFNGTPATFTVLSDSTITATVPSGAASGKITVTTPSTTLQSNVSFHVL